MTKGRNTTAVTPRLPDLLVEGLKKRAKKQGIGYTVPPTISEVVRDFSFGESSS